MSLKASLSSTAVLSALVLGLGLAAPAHAQVKAALTRDVDRPTAQPVNGNCSTFPNTAGVIKCALYTVPAGKRLVVETVGYEGTVSSGYSLYRVLFGQDGGYPIVYLGQANVFPVTPVLAYDTGTVRTYSAAQSLNISLDENQVLVGGMDRSDFVSKYLEFFSFSGYLVDK